MVRENFKRITKILIQHVRSIYFKTISLMRAVPGVHFADKFNVLNSLDHIYSLFESGPD